MLKYILRYFQIPHPSDKRKMPVRDIPINWSKDMYIVVQLEMNIITPLQEQITEAGNRKEMIL
jgi:hypothetical protein